MNAIELLANEAQRLFSAYIDAEVAYHSAPIDNHKLELDRALALDCASRIVARERAHAIVYPSRTAVRHLRDALGSEHNRLVAEHLEDVLAKLLASQSHATPDACSATPSA